MSYYEPILDISRYQYPVDFDKMWQAGVRLVILRLTVGDAYKDIEFDNFYAAVKARGFKIGAYHVVKPSISPVKQFQKIIASLPFELLDVPLTLDCELSDGLPPVTISDNIAALATSSFDLWTRYPLIYTRGEWWNTNTVSRPIFPKCKLFVARYTTLSHPWLDAPALRPRDWVDWDLWQYSADGNGQGAAHGVGSDDVDKDRSRVQDLPSTLALLNGIEPPPPDPEPIGEPTLKFITKFVLNVRSGADTTFPVVGSLPVNTVVSALQIQPTDSNSVWLEFETGKWVAMVHNGGGPYLAFHSATEGEPMTPEQLARLETVESLTAEHTADIFALEQSQVDVFTPTHKLVTTKPGGEKLRAWPGGSEAVQIYNNAMLMDLEQTRGGQKLMAFVQEGVMITGFVDPVVLLEL